MDEESKLKKYSEKKQNYSKSWNQLFAIKFFRIEMDNYKENKNSISKLEKFYENLFNSFEAMNKCLKRKSTKRQGAVTPAEGNRIKMKVQQNLLDPNIDKKFVNLIYDSLPHLPDQVQKTVLFGMTNCLLRQDNSKKSEDEVRGYYFLLQNPVFSSCDSYVVFSHLLKQISQLCKHNKKIISHWLRRLSTPKFRPIVVNVNLFVSRSVKLLKSGKLTEWWLPSALNVLQLLYDANNCVKPRLISFREFYNEAINQHVDLNKEFDRWKNSNRNPDQSFNVCNTPLVLTLVSKQQIIRHEQQVEMMASAREEAEIQVRNRRSGRVPSSDKLFLNIQVRRQHLLQDSLNQIFIHKKDLKKKLRVEFVGEPGFDMGGVTKEWFLLLLRQILQPDYNTFVYNEKTRCYWFAHNSADNSADLYLVGVLLGLAVFNNISLHLRMPLICYTKLLAATNHNSPTNHVVPVTLDDFKLVDPDMAHGLEELLVYEGDVEKDFDLRFEVDEADIGRIRTVELIEGGADIAVTNQNRNKFVQLVVDYKLNKSIHRQFTSFTRGFNTSCSSLALSFLCAEELEILLCGVVGFDIVDLQKFTAYKGYTKDDVTVKLLWQVLSELDHSKQKKFLHFCTGGDRVPVSGWKELNFTVIRAPTHHHMLPMAHTCFNQLLLPPYTSKSQLKHKLLIAIHNSEGFGLE